LCGVISFIVIPAFSLRKPWETIRITNFLAKNQHSTCINWYLSFTLWLIIGLFYTVNIHNFLRAICIFITQSLTFYQFRNYSFIIRKVFIMFKCSYIHFT
jgi:hypothetical protein